MKRQVFTVNDTRLWGVFETENVVLLNVAGTKITPQQVKALGKISTPQETYDVNDAEDAHSAKHVNHGKFVKVYLKRGMAPRTANAPGAGSRRSVETS